MKGCARIFLSGTDFTGEKVRRGLRSLEGSMKRLSAFREESDALVNIATGETLDLSAVRIFEGAVAQGMSEAELAELAERYAGGVAAVTVPAAAVALADGNFNEALLADLRIFLKKLEEAGAWAVLQPDRATCGGSGSVPVIVHTARRVKDCAAVLGVAVPNELAGDAPAVNALIASLEKKHGEYHYFFNGETVEKPVAGAARKIFTYYIKNNSENGDF